MSNRLTFGEAEFLLGFLREARISVNAFLKLQPADASAIADFAGLKGGKGMDTMTVADYKSELHEKAEKLDIIIGKVERLFDL